MAVEIGTRVRHKYWGSEGVVRNTAPDRARIAWDDGVTPTQWFFLDDLEELTGEEASDA